MNCFKLNIAEFRIIPEGIIVPSSVAAYAAAGSGSQFSIQHNFPLDSLFRPQRAAVGLDGVYIV